MQTNGNPVFRWAVTFGFVLSMVSLQLRFASAQQSQVLVWKNGDRLPGHLVAGSDRELTWRANNLFRDPIELDIGCLKQIEFAGHTDPTPPHNGFFVCTIDGNALMGDAVSLDDQGLVLRSSRFGDVKISRDHLASIVNLSTSQSQMIGEFSLDQWDADRDNKKDWQVNFQGQLVCSRPIRKSFAKRAFRTTL